MAQKSILTATVNRLLNLLITGLLGQSPRNPLDARARFGAARLVFGIVLVVAYLASICLVSWSISSFWDSFYIVFADALVSAYFIYIYFFYAVGGILIDCPECHKTISTSDTAWICGDCGFVNKRPRKFPVVRRCENEKCMCEPKAYECHHCFKLVFFSEDRDTTNPAKRYTPSADKAQRKTERRVVEAQRRHEENLKNLERQTEMARSKQRLDRAKNPKAQEELSAKVAEMRAKFKTKTEIRDELAKMRRWANDEYKNDPERLKIALDDIDELELELLG